MSAMDDANTIRGRLAGKVTEIRGFRGEVTVVTQVEGLLEALTVARRELGYEMLLDVSGVDHLGGEPRFELVYELATLDDSKHLRVKTALAENQPAPTATGLWGAADWHEREVWDMMGIPFEGHPDLRRILMWEGYPYHPLRKDFPLAGLPTEMPDVAFSSAAPMVGGPFVTAAADNTVEREPRSREGSL